MIEKSYRCSQQNLYDVCRAGWNSCSAHLGAFSGFKTKYIAPFVSGKIDAINIAEALPDAEQRTADSMILRVNLKNAATAGMDLWQRLKRYITEAYPADQLDIRLNEAGQTHYKDAGRDNWAAVKRLLLDGDTFITANSATLTGSGSMPAGFPALFTTAKTNFDTIYSNFIAAGQNDEVETQTKITANNNIFADLMSMFLDGQEIFKTDEAVKKLFTFDQVLLNVAGPGNQGFKGNITDAASDNPLPITATIAITGPTNKTVQTDQESHYNCPQLTAGTGYSITVTASGYQTQVLNNQEVLTGTMKTLDIELTAIP